jgi:RNA polymerase sigma-70 factor, ECF subfamily
MESMQDNAATLAVEFEALDAHRAYLMRIATLELRDRHVAEDVVSDVLTQAYERRTSFRGDSSLRTWLVAILKNRIVDVLRKQWREQPLEPEPGAQEFDDVFDDTGHWAQIPSDTPDPATLCEQDASARCSCCARCSAATRRRSVRISG